MESVGEESTTEDGTYNTSSGLMDDPHNGLPVFGLPGIKFDMIHWVANVSLTISILTSACVFIYLHRDGVLVFKKTIGERLTIYLAACDLCYSISHMADHSYMIAVRDHPPDLPCITMAFFLAEFILAQSLLVSFTAINALLLVVKEHKVNLGRCDWRLLSGAFGIPASVLIPCAWLGLIGPSGAWCLVDRRKATGPLMTAIISISMTFTVVANIICYLLVWLKIQKVTKATSELGSSSAGGAKYGGTAKMLMLFVAAYIIQWSTYVIYSVWALFSNPNWVFLCVVTFQANFGGVYNFVAYTGVRIMIRRKAEQEKKAAVEGKSGVGIKDGGSQHTSTSNVSAY